MKLLWWFKRDLHLINIANYVLVNSYLLCLKELRANSTNEKLKFSSMCLIGGLMEHQSSFKLTSFDKVSQFRFIEQKLSILILSDIENK